jgi:hypothetical protein
MRESWMILRTSLSLSTNLFLVNIYNPALAISQCLNWKEMCWCFGKARILRPLLLLQWQTSLISKGMILRSLLKLESNG